MKRTVRFIREMEPDKRDFVLRGLERVRARWDRDERSM